MDIENNFRSILLLRQLVKLVKRKNEIKATLRNQILVTKKRKTKSKSSSKNKKAKLKVFKKSDLIIRSPNFVRQTYSRKNHYRNEQCDLCGKVTRRQNLASHMNIHFNRKPFICDIGNCNKSFCSPATLFCHKKLHSRIKRYTCDLCPAMFHFNGSLKKHRVVHFEPKYKCTECNSMFRRTTQLKYHMQTHMEYENVMCTIPSCNRKFKNIYNVRKHIRRFHNITVKHRVKLQEESA